MPYMHYRLICILFFLQIFGQFDAVGQVNIKIGYNIAFPDLPTIESILSSYEPQDHEVMQAFGSLGFMHGIQLGVRYRWSNVVAEVGWENLSRERTALAYRASTDSFMDRQYNFSLSGFTAGMENYFGSFGLGSTLVRQRMAISRAIGNNDLNLIRKSGWNLRLHLILQVQRSSLVSLMIKPYYQFALDDYTLNAFAMDAGVNHVADVVESPKIFGISLIFYNGKQ